MAGDGLPFVDEHALVVERPVADVWTGVVESRASLLELGRELRLAYTRGLGNGKNASNSGSAQ